MVVLADDGVPEVLQGDLGRTGREGGGWRGVAWFALAVVLLVALALQYAHFEPLDLVKRYPQALASVER